MVSRLGAGSAAREHSGGGVPWVGLAGVAGVAGVALLVLADVLGSLLRPDYSPINQTISDLGIGSNGWLIDASLVVLGLCLTGVAVAFYRTVRPPRSGVLRFAATLLLACVGVGYLVAGVFPETQLQYHYTGAALVFLGSLLGFPTAAVLLRRDSAWHRWGDRSLVASLVLVVLVGVMGYTFSSYTFDSAGLYRSGEWGGLMERVVFGVILLWFAVAGYLTFRDWTSDRPRHLAQD